jgi:hypothetical protein
LHLLCDFQATLMSGERHRFQMVETFAKRATST